MIRSTKNTSGFSILMAIGVIGVLLIIVTSLAMTYIREGKLSRFSYDEVLVQTQSEGMFEYGMLKMANHRDGFQDQTFSGETDGNILDLSTSRSKGLYSEYNIIASSKNSKFTLSGSEHLIIPLFVSTGSTKIGVLSLHPKYNTGTANTEGLNISGIGGLGWTIVAMSGSENIAITGVSNIDTSSTGLIRIKRTKCLKESDGSDTPCVGRNPADEEIQYVYDETMSVANFLSTKSDPYLIIYNSNASSVVPININISSSTPFSLPQSEITTKALKGGSSQVFKFIQDKSKYHDALKYGIYNNP